MPKYRAPAHIMDFTAPSGGVTAGLFYLIGAILVFANVTAEEGETFTADQMLRKCLIKETALTSF